MNYQDIYLQTAEKISKTVTKSYSTSFYKSIQLLDKSLKQPIYNIYGMVRLADEIVDTFFEHKHVSRNLEQFIQQVWQAIEQGYSSNFILHSFQKTYHEFSIEKEHVHAFLKSMTMDVDKKTFSEKEFKEYIYGSAEVVGLMCLKVFANGKNQTYQDLKEYACSLGSFFQKINFLRDVSSDYDWRGRMYFDASSIEDLKHKLPLIIQDMKLDLINAKKGINRLPGTSKYGVLIALLYFESLLIKIEKKSASQIFSERISVSNWEKYYLFIYCKFMAIIKN